MCASPADFWKLAVESRLLSPQDSQQLSAAYTATGAGSADAQALARWLITRGAVSRYQAKLLLAGRAGPFVYGDYLVHDRVEQGRLTGLFRARHRATRHPVSLYFLTGPALQDPQVAARLAQYTAAAVVATRGEPRLARVYQWADLGPYKFIVLEDLQGESSEERLVANGLTSTGEACLWAKTVAQALTRLHASKQPHGQLRPAQIWLDQQAGAAKLLHFPLAIDPLAQQAAPEMVDYLAPELAQGRPADVRSDVYALGATLYHLLAGQPPFAGGDARQKLARHATETPQPLDQINRLVPADLARLVNYLLQKDPEMRYQQAASVAEALTPFATAAGPKRAAASATETAYEQWLAQQGAQHAPAIPAAASYPAATPVTAMPAPPALGSPQVAVAHAVVQGAMPHAAGPHAMAMAPVASNQPARAVGPAVAGPVPAAAPVAPAFPTVQSNGASQKAVANPPSALNRLNRGKRSSRNKWPMLAGVGGGAALLVLGGFLFMGGDKDPPVSANAPDEKQVASAAGTDAKAGDAPLANPKPDDKTTPTGGKNVAAATDGPRPDTVAGLDEPIWESPTAGPPIDVAYLAPGAQMLAHLRPAALIKHPEWEKISDPRASGILGDWVAKELPKLAGTTLDNVQSVTVGFLDASPAPPRTSIVIRTLAAPPKADVLAAWGNPPEEKINERAVYVTSERSFYIPAADEGRTLVIAPPQEMNEIVAANGQPPVLRRELEVLLRSSDADRELTLLVAPNFPFTGGKDLFSPEVARLRGPLDDFLTMEDGEKKLELPKAAMLSLHVSTDDTLLFAEARLYNSFAGRPVQAIAREFRKRLTQWPNLVKLYVRDLYLTPYSKDVLWDFPDQVKTLNHYTRVGIDDKQVVLRAYLPAAATHNLLLGSYLSLLETPGAAPVAVADAATQPQTVAEKLKKKTSLSFPRNTLEMTMKLLAEDVGVEIVIVGNDLQLDGITKNQSFGLDERDQPADEILRKVMKLANPAGKLVYVIKPKEGSTEDIVYITTRAGVEKRGDKLPPELVEKK